MEKQVFEITFIGAHYVGPYPGLNQSVFTLYLNEEVKKDDILLLENGQHLVVYEDSTYITDEWEGQEHYATEVCIANTYYDSKNRLGVKYNGLEWWDIYIDPKYIVGGNKVTKIAEMQEVPDNPQYKKLVSLIGKIEEPIIKRIKVIEE